LDTIYHYTKDIAQVKRDENQEPLPFERRQQSCVQRNVKWGPPRRVINAATKGADAALRAVQAAASSGAATSEIDTAVAAVKDAGLVRTAVAAAVAAGFGVAEIASIAEQAAEDVHFDNGDELYAGPSTTPAEA
jgi:hypothetical protein